MAYKPGDLKLKELSDREWLLSLAHGLDNAGRERINDFGVEGSEIIKISSALAEIISERLKVIASKIE